MQQAQTHKKRQHPKVDPSLWNVFQQQQRDTPNKDELNDDEVEAYMEEAQSIHTREICELCDSPLAYDEHSFMTCTNPKCGKVYTDTIDQSAEWRYYGADDSSASDPTRCGMPINPLLKESSYGCKVVCGRGGSGSYEMRKIRRYTEWQAMPYKEKSQYDEFQHIKTMANIAGIPKIIVDEALRYHKMISEERTFRGMNRDGIIASSVYLACRIHNYPRTAKEIADMFHIDPTSAAKGCKNAVLILNKMEKGMATNEMTHFHTTKPINFIERFCSRLQLNQELTNLARFIAIYVEKSGIVQENTPHAVASGIIYLIADVFRLNVTKNDIFQVSNISEVTINKCYKKLAQHKEQLIPVVLLKKYKIV